MIKETSESFETQSARLINWCKDHALPLWGTKGVDPSGGFWETLNMDASPATDSLRRVRVQARQTYVFAQAAHLGWYDKAKTVSDHGWDYLTSKGFQGAGAHGYDFAGIAHLLNADHSLHDGMRDSYAQAFLVLASAWRHRAFDGGDALNMLEKITGFMNTKLKADNGGWREGLPHTLPRRQNPHMHLFEAFIAAYEATDDKSYLANADHVFDLFEKYFWNAEHKTLLEFFSEDWSPDSDTGALTEPGHLMEWAWLIYNYARLSGRDVTHYADAMFETAITSGINPKTGLLRNEIHKDGTVTRGESRLWPATEFIKASVVRARAGVPGALDDAAMMIDRMFEYYLDVPVTGGWHDQRDEDGNVTSTDMPSSTFYHIFCATAEVDLCRKAAGLQAL